MSCCKKPEIFNSDYKDGDWRGNVRVVENRVCRNCGRHWWDGKEYTRKEWDALMEAK